MLGTQSASNLDLLLELMQIQKAVGCINGALESVSGYSQMWPMDPVYSIWPGVMMVELHTPLRSYSQGMSSRLSFWVAVGIPCDN